MTDVFLFEASMRAYQMAGWNKPEAKVWFEKTYGPIALEVAIIMMALIDDEDDDMGVDMVTDDVTFQAWVKALKTSGKFRDLIKKHSKELISLNRQSPRGENKAFTAISKIAMPFLIEPEGYEGETALQFEDGWKWVHLIDSDCRDFEGTSMQHCGQAVGHMFSLRDPQNKPHVTIDLSPSPDGMDDGAIFIPANDVIQLRGKQNSIPDMKYWPKIKDFVKQMNSKTLFDSYTSRGDEEDGVGIVKSRKFAEFLELDWAHDEPRPDEAIPLDQYEF